jgi:tRNA 5-methylaminomethyl-2-thiouridine biosynthesis bifunctional protein
VRVRVIDALAPASGASGNAAAVLFPKLGKAPSAAMNISFLAYAHMLRLLPSCAHAHHQIGMLKLPKSQEELVMLQGINAVLGIDPTVAQWVDASAAKRLSGLLQLATGGVWFPHGTWVRPAALIAAMLAHPGIDYQQAQLEAITSGVAHTNAGDIAASHIVLAHAGGAAMLPQLAHYKLHEVGGQISLLSPSAVQHMPGIILCHKGYAVPLPEGVLIGATYDHEHLALQARHTHHEKNIADAEKFLPGLLYPAARAHEGRFSLRCNRPGRTPLIGAIAPGVYANLAHGSRGMLSAPLGADRLAAQMLDSIALDE